MPVRCAGLDSFGRFNNVAALATCLPPTWVKDTIIRMLGTNGTEFYQSWRLADTYQTIGRCSIRVRESQAPITLIVLSEEEATALGKLFPGSKLMGQLGNLPSMKQHRKRARNDGNDYSPQDTRAYSKFKGRRMKRGQEVPDKATWYVEVRIPQLQARGGM